MTPLYPQGLTWFAPGDDRSMTTRQELLAQIVGALGGRAAEEVIFGKKQTTSGVPIPTLLYPRHCYPNHNIPHTNVFPCRQVLRNDPSAKSSTRSAPTHSAFVYLQHPRLVRSQL